MNILRLDKLGLFWLWFYVMVSLFVHSLRDMIRDVYKLCIWYSCIRAFINCILWLLLVLRRYWSFVTLIVDLINLIIAWIWYGKQFWSWLCLRHFSQAIIHWASGHVWQIIRYYNVYFSVPKTIMSKYDTRFWKIIFNIKHQNTHSRIFQLSSCRS